MKKAIISFCLFFVACQMWAQSYHFSQFFSTPLLNNPAYTGFTDGPTRLSSNIRVQGSPGNNFFTGYFSAEFDPLRNSLPMGYKSGLGIYVMNDRSMNSAIQTNSVGLSTAYHIGLDTYGERSFGLGVQASYNQRRLDYSKYTFENQFGPNGFDGALPIGEPLNLDTRQFFDVNAGICYNVIFPNKAFFAGVSAYNLLRHQDNLLPEEFTMPMRFTVQAGTQFSLNEYEKVYGSLTAMTQAKTTEITLGGAYGFKISETTDNQLMGGIWYRYKDALIPYIGFQTNGFQVGLSYDYTVSGLKTGSQIKNGYELTLVYKTADKRELKTVIPWF